MTRAKFTVHRIEHSMSGTGAFARELTTIVLFPVSGGEEGSENRRFWDATPAGEIRLSTVSAEAAAGFALGAAYYIDFTKAA